jgi:glutathione S-transferase
VLGGALSIADIAVAAQLANFRLAGEKIDGARWPKLAAWAERTLARPSFAKLLEGGAFPG